MSSDEEKEITFETVMLSEKGIAVRQMLALERIAITLEAIHAQSEKDRLQGTTLTVAMNRVADGLVQYIEKTWYSVQG
jgi:hypothetical protein